jgi:CHAD domain-containing protein
LDAASFLAGSGKERIGRFRAQRKRAAGDPASEEAVHDLRVSIRRLLAWIAAWKKLVGPDPGLEEARRSLKKLMAPLGRLRDAHVKRDGLRKLVPAGDTPSYLYAVSVASDVLRRERAVRRLLREQWPADIRIAVPVKGDARGTGGDVASEARRLLAGSAREVARYRVNSLDPGNPEALHRMRLAFKKYRYSWEVFAPLLPDAGDGVAERLHAFQTLLGTIHDCDVVLAEARSFMRGLPGYRGKSTVEAAFGRLRKESFREFRGIAGTSAGLSRVLGAGLRVRRSSLPLPRRDPRPRHPPGRSGGP